MAISPMREAKKLRMGLMRLARASGRAIRIGGLPAPSKNKGAASPPIIKWAYSHNINNKTLSSYHARRQMFNGRNNPYGNPDHWSYLLASW